MQPDFNGLKNLLHPSIDIEWAGMRSDVRSMAMSGWQFEMIRHIDSMTSQLVFKNTHCGAIGYCHHVDEWALRELHHSPGSISPAQLIGGRAMIVLQGEVRNRFHVQMPVNYSIDSLSVGCEGPVSGEWVTFDSHAKANDQPEELIVMPEDVPELLAKIRKAQEPRAKEILRDQRKRQELTDLNTKAKILTFGNIA